MSFLNRMTVVFVAAALMFAAPVIAGDDPPSEQAASPRHGMAMHGDLKYPAGFQHFAYVNPDAPKGGEMRRGVVGSFDSFNSFIAKGVPAAGVGFLGQSFLYDSLTTRSADEAGRLRKLHKKAN